MSSLLYGCESWTCYRRYLKTLDQFHLRCLRKILDKVSNQAALCRANFPGVEALITKAQLRCSGHVMRMEDSRLSKQVFCSELAIDKRKQGGRRKRYNDCLKKPLHVFGLGLEFAFIELRSVWKRDLCGRIFVPWARITSMLFKSICFLKNSFSRNLSICFPSDCSRRLTPK